MDIHEKIRAGHYENTVPWKPENVPINEDTMTVRRAREHKEEQQCKRREQHNLHRAEDARLRKVFQADLEREFGLEGHPKAGRLFEIAWEDAHSEGYEHIAWQYENLAELLR